MTPREWLDWVSGEPSWVAGYLLAMPLLVLALGLLHGRGRGNESPWQYLYTGILYAVSIPGMLGTMVLLYMLLFVRENLLDVNALVSLGPPASMAVTLAIAGRNVSFAKLPGYGRLAGFMVVLGMTFAILFVLSRTRLWLVFGGSMALLGATAMFVFTLLKWGAYMAFRRRDEPEQQPPKFGP